MKKSKRSIISKERLEKFRLAIEVPSHSEREYFGGFSSYTHYVERSVAKEMYECLILMKARIKELEKEFQ